MKAVEFTSGISSIFSSSNISSNKVVIVAVVVKGR